MRYRATALAKIAAFWREGDVAAAAAHARAVGDVAIWADWFASLRPAVFSPRNDSAEPMHTARLLLAHVAPTLASRFEDHALAGLHLASIVVDELGNVMRSALGVAAARRGGGGGGRDAGAVTPSAMRAALVCVELLAGLLPALADVASREGAAARQAKALEAKIKALDLE